MANTPEDRILAAGKAVAEIFRSGEISIIDLLAAFCGRGSKHPEQHIRKLKNRKTRNQFHAQTNALLSEVHKQAQKEALDRLLSMYESTAEDILAFADRIEAEANSAIPDVASGFSDGAQRVAEAAERAVKHLTRQETEEAYEDIARRAAPLAERFETDFVQHGQDVRQAVENQLNDLNQQWLGGLRNMRREVDDVYRQVIEAERDNSVDGGVAIRKAVNDALQSFAEKGVTGFTDRANRNWGIAEYSEMAMRTAMQRANMLATIDTMLRTGQDLCYVNRHMGSCPMCMDCEAKILSLTGRTPGYMTLQQAMDRGLFHPNCAHILLVYIEGVTRLDLGRPEDVSDLDSIRLFYKRQRQRYMERNVRKWKRKQAAAIKPEYERYCKRQVEYWQKRIRDYIKDNPQLPRRYDREGGKVALSAAAKGGIEVKTEPDLTPVIIESSKRGSDWRKISDVDESPKLQDSTDDDIL